MKAKPIFRKKDKFDGYIREMVVWRLQKPVAGCHHVFKYRFYFGDDAGTCFVRYDNERGKGDHKHVNGVECRYIFRTLESTFNDFWADVDAVIAERGITV